MCRLERLKAQILALSNDELAQLRAWLLDDDWARWDADLERDDAAGKTTPL
jgi:hypothetical protein